MPGCHPSPGALCDFPAWMVWRKKLPEGKVALLLMNNANATAELGFEWAQLPSGGWRLSAACVRVYDVWQRRSLGTLAGAGFTSAALAPRDSAFVTLADC